MGLFILGILFGWLLEWLFFNFWIKGRSSSSSAESTDTSSLRSELTLKDRTIADLKSKLEKAESGVKAAVSSSGVATTTSKAVSKAASSTKDTITKNKPSVAKSASTTKKTSKTKATNTKTTTKAKPATKNTVKKTSTTNKSTSTAKKPTTTKKPAQTKAKATTAKSKISAKSRVAKPANKTTATKKPAAKKPATRKITAKASGDDLTKLSGIGPSMALKLNDLGINSYSKLAEMDDDILRDMLETSGARLNNNKEAMDSWNEQAELAEKGDFAGLKKLQEELKK